MGKLAEIKTKETSASVEDFTNTIKDSLYSFMILKLGSYSHEPK